LGSTSILSTQVIGEPFNELGRRLQDRGKYRIASVLYALASSLEPSWSAPWFNRGLMAKFRHDWPSCYRFTLKSTELDPDFKAGWWNLGIAATALSDWVVARRAWWRYGISVPLGDGPPDMNLGAVPIRICPDTLGEVVWCRRLDPARAEIHSIPFPESQHAHGDILLTDGEPKGYRSSSGRDVPVFNALEILTPSAFNTYAVEAIASSENDANELVRSGIPREVVIEDWTSVRVLCTACSQGSPGEHEHAPPAEWEPNRRFGMAAIDSNRVDDIISHWARGGMNRQVRSMSCVLSRG